MRWVSFLQSNKMKVIFLGYRVYKSATRHGTADPHLFMQILTALGSQLITPFVLSI